MEQKMEYDRYTSTTMETLKRSCRAKGEDKYLIFRHHWMVLDVLAWNCSEEKRKDSLCWRHLNQPRVLMKTVCANGLVKLVARLGIPRIWDFYTQNLCHREAFAQNNLYIKILLCRKIDTEKLVQTDCEKKLVQTEILARRNFTQSSFYRAKFVSAQKCYAQKVLRTTFFTYRRFYTQMLLHWKRIAHRNLCTPHTFTHNQLSHKEVLLPLLDHLPFLFPLSSVSDVVTERDIAMVEVLVIYTVAIVSGMFRAGVLLFLLMQPVLIGF